MSAAKADGPLDAASGADGAAVEEEEEEGAPGSGEEAVMGPTRAAWRAPCMIAAKAEGPEAVDGVVEATPGVDAEGAAVSIDGRFVSQMEH